jgi:glycosyltransferase involved in cell wall biosynthesis
MNNNPLVSVIVTTYNRKKLLKETINSILNQTYKNFELIVVDNCSEYDFFDHIKSFNDNRIKSFQNRNYEVIAINRNFGIKKAKGEYIAFCDDDDNWIAEKLDKQISFMQDHEDVGLTYVPYSFLNADGTITGNFPKQKNIFRGKVFRQLYFKSIIANSGVVIRKDLVKEIGYLNEDIKYVAMEDYDYWLRISLKTNVGYIEEEPLLLLRKWQHNISKGWLKQWKRSFVIHRGYKDQADNWLFLKTMLNDSIYYFAMYLKSKVFS